jgi:hypothetical protein
VTPVVLAVDPASRKAVGRAALAKQAFAGPEQHREGQQPVFVDEVVPGEGVHQAAAAVHLRLKAGRRFSPVTALAASPCTSQEPVPRCTESVVVVGRWRHAE